MKKSFAKLTAITLATTTLVAVAPFQTAEAVDSPIFSDHEVVEDESEKETEEADISTGFKTVADAVAAADAHLENDPLNNGYKIEKSADNLYYVQLTMDDTKVVPEEEAEDTDVSAGFKTVAAAVAAADAHLENDPLNNGYKIEKGADDLYYVQLTIEDTKVVPEEEAEETEVSAGFKTVADAVAAADAHLENDPLNNGYKIEKGADDLYYVQLTIEDTKVVPEEEAEETEEDVDFTVGFKTLADAVAAADAHLENDPLNNGYKIEKGADDLYYVQLTIEDTKVVPEVESDEETKEKVTVKKSEEKLPETGESSPYVIFGVAALTVLAGVGLVAPSFKKEN